VGSNLALRFVAFFSLIRRRLGRCYRQNAGPHVALAQTQVRELTPFEEKNRRKCRIAAQLWRFFWPARSVAAVVGLSWGGGDTAPPHRRAVIATIVEVQENMEQFKFTFNIRVPQRLHH